MPTEQGSWNNLTTLQKIALALGIPASATILYILYRRYKESREKRLTFVGEDDTEIEMKVPQDAVKLIIGRQGAVIKQLMKETGARIDVDREELGGEQMLLISGFPVQVCRAKAAIHQILTESALVSEQFFVPQRVVGRIIGRGGETVRAITRSSGAKVTCEREAESSLSLTRLISLSGTQKQVATAKQLILEKLSEEDEFRKKLAQSAAVRGPRKQPLGLRREEAEEQGVLTQPNGAVPWQPGSPGQGQGDGAQLLAETDFDAPQELRDEIEEPGLESLVAVPKFEVPSPDFSFHADEHLEVYVSASENPNHFWVQIVGNRSLQLDKLNCEMAHYYQSDSQLPDSLSVQVGDIVAAPYADSSSWYRARVLGTLENGNLDLYWVDFGDNGEAPASALRALRTDFLSLPFQAIECSLTGIAPAGEQWEEAALDEFDHLTYCAQWKPLVARISSYVQSGMGTWPRIRLYDTSRGQNLDIGEELVRLGYALQCPQEDEGAAGDKPLHMAKDTTSEALQRMLENTTGASLESLISETQKSPAETPLTLSYISLSDGSIEQLRGDPEPAEPPSQETLVLPLQSLSIRAPPVDTKGLSVMVGSQEPGEGGSQPDPGTDVANSPWTSSPAGHVPGPCPLAEASPISLSSGGSSLSKDGFSPSLASGDSSVGSIRGCFYYLSTSDEQADSSIFYSKLGSGFGRDSHAADSPLPSTVLISSSDEVASVSGSGDDILLVEDEFL
ncbi:tudor and KH domain-containing protein isoform X1 [Alligator mississippiensis]|uniref:tudor and KH domain-containing protein isoform X1 n=1 Tax=Alligator mississippiensis TaxID=8496 RepID=UPI002877A6C2|nr:tudor and KH domain-containing protein isoform X1 [Alligator mississippiensis]XP_019334556.2 tudor and KH domain-containing protein isoform X1 [Alligator mississippiensis]XP_059574064.1 tudor and KH domain-containing protein isoform X1 [Alligator mississippiensis]